MTSAALAPPQPTTSSGLDLRRKTRRDLADRILDRATHLPRSDRALLEAVFRDGRRVAEVAALLPDIPHTTSGLRSLRRRVRRLADRVVSPRFEFVITHRADWPPLQARVATAWAIEGRSMRETAQREGISVHTVRALALTVDALMLAGRREARP